MDGWLTLSLLGALVATFMLVGFEATHSAAVPLAVLGTPFVALGVYGAWVMKERGVQIGPRGIRYRALRGMRELRWDEVTSVRRPARWGLRVYTRERTVELFPMRIAEANLAALARSDGLAPHQVGLGACQYYLAEAG